MVIKWSSFAISNLQYISETYKITYITKLVNSVALLKDFSKFGRVVKVIDNITVRQLVHEKHRIIYWVKGNEINIGAVLNSSKDLETAVKFISEFFK